MSFKFPTRVTLLLWLVLFFTIWNLLRTWTALTWQATLNELFVKPAAWVIALSGGIWSLTGFVLLWSIWQGKPWAQKLLLGATTAYTVWYWSERFIWQMPRPNLPFAVILNLLLVSFIIFTTKSSSRGI